MTIARRFRSAIVAIAAGFAASVAAQTVDVVATNGLVSPHSLTVDSAGTLYISDQGGFSFFGELETGANRIMKFVPSTSSLTLLAGDFSGNIGTNDNPTANAGFNARFFNPAGMVLSRGGLVVADSGNHTLRYVGFDGVVSNIAGAPTLAAFANGTGSAARFNTPIGLAVDSAGIIYVADSKNNVIRRIDTANAVTTYASGFFEPNGVSVGDNGDLWVADTRNHVIKSVATNGTITVRVGEIGTLGSADGLVASLTARLANPRGVVWMGAAGLLIADSGNNTIRRLYTNTTINAYSIETSVGAAGQAGFVNGATNAARLNEPVGLVADVLNGAFLVADSKNKAIRRIQQTAALPAIGNPTIGTVAIVTDPNTGQVGTVLTKVTSSVFNNDVVIAILAESGVNTYYSSGTTPTNAFVDTIPAPSSSTATAPAYVDGATTLPTTIINPVLPDLTIKAISSQSGRVASGVVSARFQFLTANPTIVGDNAASFTVNDITTGAQIYYTTDGTEPTNGTPSLGPITAGSTLSFNLNGSNMVFQMKAFKANYAPSATVSNLFSAGNFVANRISFGFDSGEASSSFIAAAGQTYYAPVTLAPLSSQAIYSLQFGLLVTNLTNFTTGAAVPAVASGAVNFDSRLMWKLPDATLRQIPPAMFTGFTFTTNLGVVTATQNFTNLLSTNTAINLLSVGWLERRLATNLFDTTSQDLIKFSLAHDVEFSSANGKVVVGGYAVTIPAAATNGDRYRISIIRPSATADGISQDVFIDAPTNGSYTTANPINAIKVVTVGSPIYLAGDAAPFRWVNAGDFGDTNLLNNDVIQVYQSAIYGIHRPLTGSDFADAMDTCCGYGTNVPGTSLVRLSTNFTGSIVSGSDSNINFLAFGDGTLDVSDVFVTFRRSLDFTLTNFMRFRSNGIHYAFSSSNSFRGVAGQSLASGTSPTPRGTPVAQDIATPGDVSSVTFNAGEIVGGQTLNIPITARVSGATALRVLMLNLSVLPLEGAPAITTPVQFTPGAAIGAPTVSQQRGARNYSAAWLNNTAAGLVGDALVGTLTVTLPAGAGANAAYAVRFDHASASPTGMGSVPSRNESGLITTRTRDTSSWSDAIPDAWRLRHFGALNNLLSAANADADGDGIPNWAEFRAGTDPADASSGLQLRAPGLVSGGPRLRWPTAVGKTYVVEVSTALVSPNWVAIATGIVGNGRDIEFQTPPPGGPRFYRVRLVEP